MAWQIKWDSHTDSEILEQVKLTIKNRNLEMIPKDAEYVTLDGRRSRGTVIEPETGTGRIIAWILAPLRKRIPSIEILHYEYNDRFDAAELNSLDNLHKPMRKWLRPIAALAIQHMKERFLEGKISPSAFRFVSDLVKGAIKWGPMVTEEVVVLLFSQFLSEKVHPDILRKKPAQKVYKSNDIIDTEFIRHRIPLRDTVDFREHVNNARYLRNLHQEYSVEENLSTWCKLLESFSNNKWQGSLSGFAEVCFRDPYHDIYVVNPFPVGRRTRLKQSHDLSWLFKPIRKRVLRYATDDRVRELNEFLSLSALLPPEGYDIIHCISSTSGFKIVYLAQDSEGREVVLKRYKHWEDNHVKEFRSRLGLEAEDIIRRDTMVEWLGEIRHTFILPCWLIWTEEGTPFILEPLLEKTLDKVNKLDPNMILDYFHKLCQALAYLHNKGYLHCDIKLDNIGIQDGEPVLLDFGIATHLSSDYRGQRYPGSIKTRAPELFAHHTKATPASDVWALGASIIALASGGEYPLLKRDEVENMPLIGKRRIVRQKILNRIDKYRKLPHLLVDRIEAVIPNDYHAIHMHIPAHAGHHER